MSEFPVQEYIVEQLKNCQNEDRDEGHLHADRILCSVLICLGYQKNR